ncbi:uncharacterized protein [Periplaneta americana]|uniref:uncharacterized protein n=1 Tax=Periplaneta americana TaxID=6978 RepID=UPI0037E7030F
MSSSESNQQASSPEWLNKSFLEKVLRSADDDPSITVTSVDINPATAPGDNYMSMIYRIKVHMIKGGQMQNKSLIAKTMAFGDRVQKFTKESEIFEQETKILKDVIPAMHRVLDEVMPGKYHPFAAKHIYSHVNEISSVIITEDLKELGFRNLERTAGLDMEHCVVVLRSLARFHAASVALKEREPEVLEPFKNVKMMQNIKEEFGDFVNSTVLKIANDVEKWPEYGEKYAHKIRDLSANAIVRYMQGRSRNEYEFNVLSHGDLWVSNLMFRYDSHNNIDVRFVDYQLCYWVSPAVDLQYFLNSSTTINLLDKYHLLVDEYHKTLGETLTLLGFEHLHPTRESLERQLVERNNFGILSVFTIRSFALADRNNVQDINEAMKDGESYNYSELYREYLKVVLPLFDEKGWS